MSAAPWFNRTPLPAVGERIALDREEARHATGSRRMAAGDTVVLVDGKGGVAEGQLVVPDARGSGVMVEVMARREIPAPTPSLLVGTAVPKGDRWSTLLDMAAQLGAATITPLECERSVIRGASVNRPRAERILLEGCKQARSAWAPRLMQAMTPAHFAERAVAEGATLIVAHPGGRPLSAVVPRDASRLALVIGPEGGFTDRECDAMTRSGGTLVSLGETILRIETAVAALLAALRLR